MCCSLGGLRGVCLAASPEASSLCLRVPEETSGRRRTSWKNQQLLIGQRNLFGISWLCVSFSFQLWYKGEVMFLTNYYSLNLIYKCFPLLKIVPNFKVSLSLHCGVMFASCDLGSLVVKMKASNEASGQRGSHHGAKGESCEPLVRSRVCCSQSQPLLWAVTWHETWLEALLGR